MQSIKLRVSPKQAADMQQLKSLCASKINIPYSQIDQVIIRKRAIDARQKNIFIELSLDIYEVGESYIEDTFRDISYGNVHNAPSVIVVGAGPAGLFAALRLIELGKKPIIVERGQDVMNRRKDIAIIEKNGIVNTESNYGYGEGGAGAFSDGKLYTRSTKRGDVNRVLRILCKHGASKSILIDAHPHIGTERLPVVIKAIREQILASGGEVYFNTKMTELIMKNGSVTGIITADGREFTGPVILATGHSARDVYRHLWQKKVDLETKGIAVGVRLEHPQHLIDQIRYHSVKGRGDYLPAAEYTYTAQVEERGVYSFCMCPGGFIVPASTSPGEMVVNGMSPANRGSNWANSGMVVEIRPEDFSKKELLSPLQCLEWVEELERSSFYAANRTLRAPAQRMTDFIARKTSVDLPSSSYRLGLTPGNLYDWMPAMITERLARAFKVFDKKTPGFLTSEAQLIAIESRTSSPVRIPRRREDCKHVSVDGLYPAGEGAGYAGGIVSAALDGINCADAVATWV